MNHKTDSQRAEELGMTLDQFQIIAGFDPQADPVIGNVYGPSDTKRSKKKKKEKKKESDASHYDDNAESIGDGDMLTFETDDDINNKNALELEHYWDRPVVTEEDKALYYGWHVHGKDNIYGLHSHYPGGPLGGGHVHGPQNPLGYHTHRYTIEELTVFKFARPGLMIQLDGPHTHEYNAPDGKHKHHSSNFGPAKS